ncbi:MAG: hypothetical protein RJA98_4159 [Pseudomonadota bacterium]|jgi:hypothetical protein
MPPSHRQQLRAPCHGLALATSLGTALIALSLCGCDVAYLARYDMEKQACNKLVDFEARKACVAKLPPTDYQTYEAQRGKLADGESEKSKPAPKAPVGCFKREATGETVCPN